MLLRTGVMIVIRCNVTCGYGDVGGERYLGGMGFVIDNSSRKPCSCCGFEKLIIII